MMAFYILPPKELMNALFANKKVGLSAPLMPYFAKF